MNLDTQMRRVIDELTGLANKPIETLSPDDARREATPADAIREVVWKDGLDASPEPVGAVEDLELDGPGGPLLIRVYWPIGTGPEPLPVLVYVHGGGWVLADLDTYDATPRALANSAGCIVVSVEYRHAPEHRFPAAHDDVLAATRFVMASADQLGGDPTRVAIGGESAGANMAIATCMALKEAGEELPLLQVLVYPVTDMAGDNYASYGEFRDAKPLNTAMVSWFGQHTAGDPADVHDLRLSPLLAPSSELSGLPPALVITAENDPLRDQGEAFAGRLQEAGVRTILTRYEGVTHEFFGMGAVHDKAKQAVHQATLALREAFGLPAAGDTGTLPADAGHVIAADHAAVAQLFALLDQRHNNRDRIVEQVIHGLSVHAAMEEQLVYPELRRALPDGDVAADHALDEHQEMKDLLVALDKGRAGDDDFETSLSRLMEVVREHVAEEERDVLPALREAVGEERMRELAPLAMHAKKAAPTRPHPHAPATPPGNVVAGGVASLLDKAKDKLSRRS